MEGSRSSSRSRRSYPNLHNLSLAPLSSNYPLDASAPPSPSEGATHTLRTSYIAQKSAPTTPGILGLSHSRSNSRNGRRRSNKAYAYDGYFLNPDAPVRDVGDIPKAKSTSAMLPGVSFAEHPGGSLHARKSTTPLSLRTSRIRYHTDDDDWLHRAGLAIAGETRDSKGQGWLVRRESSTSLVGQSDEYEQHPSHDGRHMALLSGEHLADVEYSGFSPRMSRTGSRIQSRMGSRVQSARNSRRGSRVGSRVDMMMSSGPRTPGSRHSLELEDAMFEEDMIEPDFVDEVESDGDEEEVARLAQERGFGLGGWMDRLIGWTLFSVDEDGEESSEDEEDAGDGFRPESMTKEELKLRREVEAKRRKLERETIIAASAVRSEDRGKKPPEDAEVSNSERAANDEGGGWQDAAWLLGVASKVIL